jgi:hypothetical protein
MVWGIGSHSLTHLLQHPTAHAIRQGLDTRVIVVWLLVSVPLRIRIHRGFDGGRSHYSNVICSDASGFLFIFRVSVPTFLRLHSTSTLLSMNANKMRRTVSLMFVVLYCCSSWFLILVRCPASNSYNIERMPYAMVLPVPARRPESEGRLNFDGASNIQCPRWLGRASRPMESAVCLWWINILYIFNEDIPIAMPHETSPGITGNLLWPMDTDSFVHDAICR